MFVLLWHSTALLIREGGPSAKIGSHSLALIWIRTFEGKFMELKKISSEMRTVDLPNSAATTPALRAASNGLAVHLLSDMVPVYGIRVARYIGCCYLHFSNTRKFSRLFIPR